MRNYQKLTPAEKHINRLRKAFEKNPADEASYLAWSDAVNAFMLTRDGAAVYRRNAREALVKARFFTPTRIYRNGYEYAVAMLYNAELLDKIVEARERVDAETLPGLELSPPPLPQGA